MFETLTKGFRTAKQKFQGLAELDEKTIDEALGEVRTSLLEADVGFEVVQEFCKQVREKAVGVIVKVQAPPPRRRSAGLPPRTTSSSSATTSSSISWARSTATCASRRRARPES